MDIQVELRLRLITAAVAASRRKGRHDVPANAVHSQPVAAIHDKCILVCTAVLLWLLTDCQAVVTLHLDRLGE